MLTRETSSDLLDYLEHASDDALIMAFVRHVRAWRQISGEHKLAELRRQRIEANLTAMLAADPARRIPLAVAADLEQPGPLPRLITDRADEWLTSDLVRTLLDTMPSMDERYRPLMLHCAQLAIADGVEDGQTVLLYITSLRDAGEIEEAERLGKRALAVAEGAEGEMEEVYTLLALLAEMAFDDGRFDEALGLWQRQLERPVDLAPILNNCGAALQHLGRPVEACRAFRDAAHAARRDAPNDPVALRALGSAYVNAAMQALERGRTGSAVDLAQRGAERYRDLLARHPGHSDLDIVDLFAPLVSALDEAGRIHEANALMEEMLSLARARYTEAPEIAASGLVEVLRALHQDALAAGRYEDAAALSKELRALAERHRDRPFGVSVIHAALALAAEADALFLAGETHLALSVYEEVETLLPEHPPNTLATEIVATRLNHAMALNDAGERAAAADRIRFVLPPAEALAANNNWLWTTIARGYANLAVVEGERGRAVETRTAIEQAEQAFAQIRAGSRSQRIDTIEQATAIANGFSHIGDYDVAARMLRMAADDARSLGKNEDDPAMPVLLFAALNDLGLTEYAAGRDRQAADAFAEASRVAKAAPTDSMVAERVAIALVNRAAALTEAGRLDAAWEALEEAAPLTGPGKPGWTDYLNNRAAVFSGQGAHEAALGLFMQAHDAADDIEDSSRATLNIAKSMIDLERWSEARSEALSLVDALQDTVTSPDGVDTVTLYFWLAARVLAGRGAVVTETPVQAIRETSETLATCEELLPVLERDRPKLHGEALKAYGDALAADHRYDEAEEAWDKARALLQGENPEG